MFETETFVTYYLITVSHILVECKVLSLTELRGAPDITCTMGEKLAVTSRCSLADIFRASHAFFNHTLAGLSSLPSSAAAVSASGVPVIIEYCQSSESQACTKLFQHTEAAVGNVPQNCSRRGALV